MKNYPNYIHWDSDYRHFGIPPCSQTLALFASAVYVLIINIDGNLLLFSRPAVFF